MSRLPTRAAIALLVVSSSLLADASHEALRAPTAFNSVRNQSERSVALFTEAAKVLQHPRCLGTKELPCNSCHMSDNTPTLGAVIKSIPGSNPWALAPASMAWQGLSIEEICVQLKDPLRNGNRSLAQIEEHLAKDHLVGWAWHPGDGRLPAPGSQQIFGELIAAWIKAGAHCPSK